MASWKGAPAASRRLADARASPSPPFLALAPFQLFENTQYIMSRTLKLGMIEISLASGKPGAPPNGYRRRGLAMRNVPRLIVFTVFAVIVGGAIFLATWDIPAPVATIEKVIPDDRFPR